MLASARKAPVISHTVDKGTLSAVHGKLAAEETVNRAIFFGCIGARAVYNVLLLRESRETSLPPFLINRV